ncbi:MAG: TldD/PmbA family protein [Thermoplasmata archaeon]|nr:MAG: TldD/PmbA family protein [Thermoplasmata archaeon]RLF70562.1 MAG: TldD/PmbA family protein [Thermoplasmata archaeon]RLF70652.1 MAG: TldD/PmbA family protein [Thermoplasmata archaeon]HDD60385.1 TldD/PmbA family protein [Euryarchaeota archaeon]
MILTANNFSEEFISEIIFTLFTLPTGGGSDLEDKLRRVAEKFDVEFWDFRINRAETTNVEVRMGEVKKVLSGVEETFSVRVISRGAWGFFAGAQPTKEVLKEAFRTAVRLAESSSVHLKRRVNLAEVRWERAYIVYRPKVDPRDVDIEEKIDIVKRMNTAIVEGGLIRNVSTSYSDGWMRTEIVNSEGTEVVQEIPRVLLQANITAGDGGRLMGYRTRIGSTRGFETFRERDPESAGREAAEIARRLLKAGPAPSGELPVVTDPELTGVFVHEAIGHATEADTVLEGESVLEGRLGEMLGSEIVTIIDDPSIPGAFGSFTFDDEGVRGRRKALIEKGILREFIHTRETAGMMGMEPNGGARAESGHVKPLVRMSNTILLGGEHTFEELIEDIKLGIYAKGTRGGQVDPARGTFQFNAQEAYLVEKGEITKPLKDVSLSGSILETLKLIDALEKESRLGSPGFCGKGQLVPVGDGGPHMRIKKIYVGGEG